MSTIIVSSEADELRAFYLRFVDGGNKNMTLYKKNLKKLSKKKLEILLDEEKVSVIRYSDKMVHIKNITKILEVLEFLSLTSESYQSRMPE